MLNTEWIQTTGKRRRWSWLLAFFAICTPAAAIIILCLHNNLYNSSVGDIFDLCMDVMGSLVCVLLFYGYLSARGVSDSHPKEFVITLFLNAWILLLDTVMWALSGHTSLRTLHLIISTIFYVSDVLLFYFFWRYVLAVLQLRGRMIRRSDLALRILLVPGVLLCLSNLFVPVFFSITEDSIFQKEPGYPLGYWYMLVTFTMLIAALFHGRLSKWQSFFSVLFALTPIGVLILTQNQPDIAIVYTTASISILMINCVLFTENIHMRELIIRIFSLLLLCVMLLCGPMLYRVSLRITALVGYQRAQGAFEQTTRLLDEAGLERLCNPKNTKLYRETREDLRGICRAVRMENLYVEIIDPTERSRSFVMAVANTQKADKALQKTLGWPGASTWSETSRLTEPELFALTGEIPDFYSEQNNDYGHNLDWFFPYKNADGEVAALIGADYEVRSQQIDAMKHTIANTLPVLGLYLVTLLVLLVVLGQTFVNPIHIISNHIERFLSDENPAKGSLDVWGGYEIAQLAKSFGIMASDLKDYETRLKKDAAERERIRTELTLAANIQASYLPGGFPPFPNRHEFDINAIMQPAKEVGGDFYDFFLIDEDHLALAVADVCGKGIPASLYMMISKTMIKTAAQLGLSPAGVLEKVNEQLAADNKNHMFVTVWLGILEISTGTLTFSDAGHEQPILYHEGKWQILPKTPKMPLGLKKRPTDPRNPKYYANESITLAPGDGLLQYSDGVTEAFNPDNKMFGEDGLLSALEQAPSVDCSRLPDYIKKCIDGFADGAEQFDDTTLLYLRYYGRDKADQTVTR